MKTTIPVIASKLTDQQLADRLVAQHHSRDVQTLYGRYVIERSLRPTCDAKEFAVLLRDATPNLHVETADVEWVATHTDTLLDVPVMVVPQGVFNTIYWQHGVVGSDPGSLSDRYVPLDIPIARC